MARIFVVEDNESLREAVCSYLRLNDHEVVEFSRLGGVLEAIDTNPPDLIVAAWATAPVVRHGTKSIATTGSPRTRTKPRFDMATSPVLSTGHPP